jgi:transcriptional regulator with XRE-family HTH domain
LRKYLGWSGSDFAEYMGVAPETVSRWENGSIPMGPLAERLLRLAVLSRQPANDYSLDVLKGVAQKTAPVKSLKVRVAKGGWRTETA